MDAQFWTYLLVGVTFSLYIGIAIWSRAQSTKEFYIASGGIHPVLNLSLIHISEPTRP